MSLSRDIARHRDQRAMWLYRQEAIKVSYHPAKFLGHRYSDSEDIVVSVCHVISKGHLIKDSCDFIGKSPAR